MLERSKDPRWRRTAWMMVGLACGFVGAAACGGGASAVAHGTIQALEVLFDGGPSGMTATHVQGAVEELDARIDGLTIPSGTAAGTSYDNASSGLSATTAQDALDELAAGRGSLFTRWGNTTAPAGTELVYSGRGFVSHSNYNGSSGKVLLVKAGDPSTTGVVTAGLTYEAITSAGTLPPGITGSAVIQGAVCWAPRPTTVIWGTHTAPSGWAVLYKGFALSSAYNVTHAIDPICVDADDFDGSVTRMPADIGSALEGVTTHSSPDQVEYPDARFIKAAVIMKLP